MRSTMETLPGWWRPNTDTLEYMRCLAPEHCAGKGVDSPCGPHRTGILCALCEEGYRAAHSKSECQQCPDTKGAAWGWAAFIIVVCALFITAVFFLVSQPASRHAPTHHPPARAPSHHSSHLLPPFAALA